MMAEKITFTDAEIERLRDLIEKAFNDPVEFQPWGAGTETGLRQPRKSEVKARLLTVLGQATLGDGT